jgi:hypothetical protein
MISRVNNTLDLGQRNVRLLGVQSTPKPSVLLSHHAGGGKVTPYRRYPVENSSLPEYEFTHGDAT